MTHYELCKLTAERFLKDNYVILYEYQSTISSEHPDVLCYKTNTTLFEIKMSKADFKSDSKKDSRIKYKIKYYRGWNYKTKKSEWQSYTPEKKYNEKPHLGGLRYYVCPAGIINIIDLPEGWGLYWYENKKFYKKKESSEFVRNIHAEMMLLSHAFRKYTNDKNPNILVSKKYIQQ